MLEGKYNFKLVEDKWQNYWQEKGVYEYKKDSNKPTFSIDTPPPTVSGKLHIGHIYGFSQADMYARYQRMQGKNAYMFARAFH